ncbi:MAG: hypothetical protein IVW54_06250 [Candidatus Binataceae bacterium]|nr:hypothetical protein [Candidatus Binataceae bacterium]
MITNIAGIDEAAERFQINAYLFADWRDPRLQHPPKPGGLPVSYRPGEIWHPQAEFVNAVRPHERQDISLAAEADGTVHYVERLDAELSSKFFLRSFPFDSQTLQIVIHPFASEARYVTYTVDRARSSTASEFNAYSSLADWKVTGMTPVESIVRSVNGGEVSEVRFEIKAVRQYEFYIWKIFLPLFLMVMLSWTVFWMDPFDLKNQIQVAVVTLLTVIAFALAISSSLPKVPYLTFSDAFFLTCYIFVFISIIELMTVHVTHRRRGKDFGLRIRRVSRWLVPLGFCLTLAVIAFRFLT